ncbi:hypothetical protein PAXINDRAFT_160985 [Paxillus involutus ATCC 200175]|nr:hypothetical protein PAXINDRAFT_160985 [Paxillus involutus ATCC 200175]
MSTSTSLRRRPHCHKCGSLMQGHRRKSGTLICPDELSLFTGTITSSRNSHSTPFPSPPASSGGSPPPSPPPYTDFCPALETPTFKAPPGDRWHWKNPNWVSPPRKMRLHSPNDLERDSLAPTEPLTEPDASYRFPSTVHEEEEGHAENASWSDNLSNKENDDPVNGAEYEYLPAPSNSLSPRPWTPFSQSPVTDVSLNTVLRASTPLFKVFRTPREDLDDVRRTAEREGKHVGIIDAPPAHLATTKVPREKAAGSVWVLVSDRIEDLKYAIDSQQRGMPGAFFPEEQQHRGMGFFQVALAGVMGGLVVTVGLSFM